MIIDTRAHVVPGNLIETLHSERRLFPPLRLLADAGAIRTAFAGQAPTPPIGRRLSDLAPRREWLTSACRPSSWRRLDRCPWLRATGGGGCRLTGTIS